MELSSLEQINATCDFFAVLLVVLLLVGMTNGSTLRKRRLLLVSLWLQLVTLSSDMLGWCFEGLPGTLAFIVTRVAFPISLIFGVLTCITIMTYAYTDVSGDPLSYQRADALIISLWGTNIINLLLSLSSPWTHAYYLIDASNHYVKGPLAYLNDVLYLAQLLLMFLMVVRLHERHGATTTIHLALCGVMGTAAVIADLTVEGLSILEPSVSLLLVLLCVGVQNRLEEDLAKARADAAESRVRLLSGQIHPHFVFNSLAAIKELISEDQQQAEQSIQDFSDYLRSHLDVMSITRVVPFSQEMEHVRHYVALELADAAKPLDVVYDLQVEDFLVPPLTVQPLVENAIRHGIRTREEGGTVRVETRRIDGAVVVRVSDDGRGFSSATSRQVTRSRVGIANVRERLEQQCSGTLEVTSGEEGTVATMTIPEVRRA